MLFNSYLFLFLFLPVTLIGYYLLRQTKNNRLTIVWLIGASLIFYGSYNYLFVLLLLGSIAFNYLMGLWLNRETVVGIKKLVLIIGITGNILLLGYFKYANFFIENVNSLFSSDFLLNTIIFPLAISFFTIQQVSYLVDVYRGGIEKHSFLDYCLFVTFFPKLISGPIVRFKEMMPQVMKKYMPPVTKENVAIGLSILILGLFKKVVLADSVGGYADDVFYHVARGGAISFIDSWSGALAYTFQIYFDFSGYCDMAIGIALMFGIRLPLNFYSPYKATSIIDFWSRWHMTLSRFIRDYLYIPLGGNRRGFPRQIVNLMLVMVIAGFWHGSGWTFVVWGALHGLYLAINHTWRRIHRNNSQVSTKAPRWKTAVSIVVTFVAVTVAWVFFRADTVATGVEMLKGMFLFNGFALPLRYYEVLGPIGQVIEGIGITVKPLMVTLSSTIWIPVLLIICWFLPNVQEYMAGYRPSLDSFGMNNMKTNSWLRWTPSLKGALFITIVAMLGIPALLNVHEFIYFKF